MALSIGWGPQVAIARALWQWRRRKACLHKGVKGCQAQFSRSVELAWLASFLWLFWTWWKFSKQKHAFHRINSWRLCSVWVTGCVQISRGSLSQTGKGGGLPSSESLGGFYCLLSLHVCLPPLPWSLWFSLSILSSKICCRMAFLHSSLISGPLRRLLSSGTAPSCPSTLSPLPDTPPKARAPPTSRAESTLSGGKSTRLMRKGENDTALVLHEFLSSIATVQYYIYHCCAYKASFTGASLLQSDSLQHKGTVYTLKVQCRLKPFLFTMGHIYFISLTSFIIICILIWHKQKVL